MFNSCAYAEATLRGVIHPDPEWNQSRGGVRKGMSIGGVRKGRVGGGEDAYAAVRSSIIMIRSKSIRDWINRERMDGCPDGWKDKWRVKDTDNA